MERYGIHALESIYLILGPGFDSIRNVGDINRNIVHLKHKKGIDVIIAAINDMYGSFGILQLYGTKGHAMVSMKDSFFSFKKQLEAFMEYLKTGILPFPFDETIELMKIIIAGIESRENKKEILIKEE